MSDKLPEPRFPPEYYEPSSPEPIDTDRFYSPTTLAERDKWIEELKELRDTVHELDRK